MLGLKKTIRIGHIEITVSGSEDVPQEVEVLFFDPKAGTRVLIEMTKAQSRTLGDVFALLGKD